MKQYEKFKNFINLMNEVLLWKNSEIQSINLENFVFSQKKEYDNFQQRERQIMIGLAQYIILIFILIQLQLQNPKFPLKTFSAFTCTYSEIQFQQKWDVNINMIFVYSKQNYQRLCYTNINCFPFQMDETTSKQYSGNSSPLSFHINIHNYNQKSKRADLEYCIQHSRWNELRSKMKSMKLSQYTSNTYLKAQYKERNQLSSRKEQKKRNFNSTEKKLPHSKYYLGQKDMHQSSHQNPQNFIGNTKELQQLGSKKSTASFNHNPQIKRFLETYLKDPKPSERTRPQTQQYKRRNNIVPKQEDQSDTKIQKFVMNGQKQAVSKVFDIKNKKRIRNFNLHLNLKKITDKIEQNNKNVEKLVKNKKSNNQRLDSRQYGESIYQQFEDDYIELSRIEDKDYRQRVIVRRKTNVNGECFQAIEAALIKGQIILFTIDVTTGNLNDFDCLHGFHSVSSTQYSIRKNRLKSERQIKYHNPTGTRQLKLLVGPNQAKQYLEIFCLSSHPLQFTKSLTKAAIILVDYLIASEGVVKIEKSEVISVFTKKKGSTREEKAKQLFEDNELVRWKNKAKICKNDRLVMENNIINHSYSHQISHNKHKSTSENFESQVMYYQVYGHPHPIFNGKQSDFLLKKDILNDEESQDDKKIWLSSNHDKAKQKINSQHGQLPEQKKYEQNELQGIEILVKDGQKNVSIEQSQEKFLQKKQESAENIEIKKCISEEHIDEIQNADEQINGLEKHNNNKDIGSEQAQEAIRQEQIKQNDEHQVVKIESSSRRDQTEQIEQDNIDKQLNEPFRNEQKQLDEPIIIDQEKNST